MTQNEDFRFDSNETCQFNILPSDNTMNTITGILHTQISTIENPVMPMVLPQVRLFAVLGIWMEADIIEATVENA
jgi:hypothetical protein